MKRLLPHAATAASGTGHPYDLPHHVSTAIRVLKIPQQVDGQHHSSKEHDRGHCHMLPLVEEAPAQAVGLPGAGSDTMSGRALSLSAMSGVLSGASATSSRLSAASMRLSRQDSTSPYRERSMVHGGR